MPAAASAQSCVTGVVGQVSEFQGLSSPAEQCYTVPAGVTTVHVSATGAAGAQGTGGGGQGGLGATVVADVALPAGTTVLYVEVGTTAGFNGGGSGGTGNLADGVHAGGIGGGASDVSVCSAAVNTGGCALTGTGTDPRLIVAGGGGGGGGAVTSVTPGVGGSAGYVGVGGGPSGNGGEAGGGGGTGSAGYSPPDASAAKVGVGGAGAAGTSGGGGGGGWWGGGGASEAAGISGAGGGGSSFGPVGAVFATAPMTSFPASVSITPYASSSNETGPVGPQGLAGPEGAAGFQGAAGTNGKNGKLELVTCKAGVKTVKKTVGGKRKTVKVPDEICSTKTVSGTVKFTTSKLDHATISRAGRVYASGTAVRSGKTISLTLIPRRRFARAAYTLTLTTTGKSHQTTRRTVSMN